MSAIHIHQFLKRIISIIKSIYQNILGIGSFYFIVISENLNHVLKRERKKESKVLLGLLYDIFQRANVHLEKVIDTYHSSKRICNIMYTYCTIVAEHDIYIETWDNVTASSLRIIVLFKLALKQYIYDMITVR